MEEGMRLFYHGVDITEKTALCTCKGCLASVIKYVDEAKVKKPLCHFIGNCINKSTGYGQIGDCLCNDVQSINCKHRCEGSAKC